MKSTLTRVLAAAGIVAVLAAGAPGAGADPLAPKATARLDVHQVLAGAQQTFTLTVGNPVQSLLNPIRAVKIVAPGELLTIAAPVDAAGWLGTVSAGGSTLTYKATGAGIAGGATQAFTFVTDAQRPASDLARSFAVSTSTNGGTTSTYTPVQQSAGALGVRVRTLEILGIAVTEPAPVAGAAQPVFTAGQDLVVGVRVSNAGGAAQTVSTALTGDTATTSSPASITLEPGEIADVPVDVTLGDAIGHGKLVASAVAGESIAATRFLAYVAQQPLELLVDPDNQTPSVVVPGRQVSFSQFLAVRGDESAPAIDIDPARSAYRFADGALVAPLGEALHLEAGHGQWLPPTPPVTVPALADGDYAGVLHLEGVDAHGAAVATDLPLRSGSLVADSLAPVADLVLGDGGQPVTYGERVPLTGTIEDRDGPCGECTFDHSELQLFDANGALLASSPFSSQICEDEGSPAGGCEPGWTNTDGTVGGYVTVQDWPAETVAVRLVTDVVDDVDLTSTTATFPLLVDLVAPSFVHARTGDDVDLDVILSEDVEWGDPYPTPQLDFACDGHQVVDGVISYREVWLQLSPVPAPNEVLSCRYDPVGNPINDRVGLTLPDFTFTTEDGIAPEAPSVDAPVFTNTSTPTLAVSGLQPGDSVDVLEDGAVVGSATATDDAVEITTTSLGTNDRVVTLAVQVTDPSGNVGDATRVELTLDFTAPALAEAVIEVDDRQVTVTFAEPLVGPDAVDDWSASGPSATGPRQTYALGSADVEDDVVTLTIADPRFGTGAVVDGVAYEVLAADGSTRLTDRAGNVLADSTRTL